MQEDGNGGRESGTGDRKSAFIFMKRKKIAVGQRDMVDLGVRFLAVG